MEEVSDAVRAWQLLCDATAALDLARGKILEAAEIAGPHQIAAARAANSVVRATEWAIDARVACNLPSKVTRPKSKGGA
jgi:hypothetical protein